MSRQVGTVFKRMKGFYYVDVEGTIHLCRIKGNLFQKNLYGNSVAVGDQVEIDLDASEDAGWIYKILPRHSKLSRPARDGKVEQVLVSNIESLLIITSVKDPPFRSGIVDRFLITAQRGGLKPVIVLNKIDLSDQQFIMEITAPYESLGYSVLQTSAAEQTGLDELKALLQKKTSVLSGHSGVGKSSLLKALFPNWEIKIGSVSSTSHKGKHTTTISEMFPLPGGGYVVDTPGIRELGLYQLPPEELDQFFIEFETVRNQCKYKGCSHRHEPSCGIQDAVRTGHITEQRYHSYCSIYESLLENNLR
ncbi:MAG: ribosome small subunit-dependent GTPase A [SAR324 cluster bacterium]|nr:ribosome small subunit-dependent GTPase A [SAR324 cluster bacterium]